MVPEVFLTTPNSPDPICNEGIRKVPTYFSETFNFLICVFLSVCRPQWDLGFCMDERESAGTTGAARRSRVDPFNREEIFSEIWRTGTSWPSLLVTDKLLLQ